MSDAAVHDDYEDPRYLRALTFIAMRHWMAVVEPLRGPTKTELVPDETSLGRKLLAHLPAPPELSDIHRAIDDMVAGIERRREREADRMDHVASGW